MSKEFQLHRWKNQMLARVFARVPSLAAWWGGRLAPATDKIPWAEAKTPLHVSTVAVVTTGGVHLRNQQRFDMADPDGDPTYREIPLDTPRDALTITHDYYDHRDAEEDLNLVLPLERLAELVDLGYLGAVHPLAYSFMGHIDGSHVETLVQRTGPEVARRLRSAHVDYVLLVPA